MIVRVIPAGDLAIENHAFVGVSGVQHYRRKIASRFRWFLGEWFIDRRQGVPYHRDIFPKGTDSAVIANVFLRVLRRTPGILSVISFKVVVDRQARHLSFQFEALSEAGPIIVAPEDRDFIITSARA